MGKLVPLWDATSASYPGIGCEKACVNNVTTIAGMSRALSVVEVYAR